MAPQLVSVASGQLRHRHYVLNPNTSLYERTTLIEGQRTNLVLRSENFGTTWTANGSPTRSAAAHTASGVTLDLIGDDDAGAAESYSQNITFTGDAVKAVSVHMRAGTSPSASGNMVRLRDNTAAADRLLATITWSGGVPSVVMSTGTHLGTVLLAGGVYRFLFQSTSVTAANTNTLYCYGATTNVTTTGNVYAGGVQAENAPVPSSYIPTTSATVTRSADVPYLPFTAPPQAMTAYVRMFEFGTSRYAADAGVAARVLHIGLTSATTDPRLALVAENSTGRYQVLHDNGTALASSAFSSGSAPSIGALVELRATLGADGAVRIHRSVNGAAEESATASSAPSGGLAAAWAGERLYLGTSPAAAAPGFNAFTHVRIERGSQSLATMRTLAGVS